MEIVDYNPTTMLQDLIYLHRTQNIEDTSFLTPDTIPTAGYVAYLDNKPIAAGFLRRIEGGFAQLDTLVSNKDYPPHIRHEALDSIVHTLLSTGKALGIKGIISLSVDEGIVKRAISLGFAATPQFVLTLPLT